MVEKNDNNIKSVQKALSLLQCFSLEDNELTFTELVKKSQLPKSTTSRILSTLEIEGFVVRDLDTQKYKLGHSVFFLGLIARESMDIRRQAIPYMENMTKITNETSNVYILENYDRVCIAQVESPMPIKQLVKVGERFPIWAGATGRSILANLDESMWSDMVKEVKKFTDKTLIDHDQFYMDLKEIRYKGYSVSMGEKFQEVGCVAAPIFNDAGVIGCISISGPVHRFPEDLSGYIKLVTESASSISRSLGYREKRSAYLE